MNPQKELDGMQQKCRNLDTMNDEYRKLLIALADAKLTYDKAYIKALAEEKVDGTAVSILKEMAKGKIIKLNYEVIIAEAGVKANREAMANLRSQIDSYRSRLAWLKAEMFRTE